MLKKTLLFLLFGLITSLSFNSCTKKDDNNSVFEVKTVLITANLYDKWVYFSFDKGTTSTTNYDVTDFTTKTDWDLAFHRNDVRTNSGASTTVNALGGVKDMGIVSFESVTDAPTAGYTVDASSMIVSNPNIGGVPTMYTTTTNAAFKTWLTINTAVNPPVYTVNNNIFVVKTASGKYAKVWLKGYVNPADSKSGYITMQYLYLSDGSTKF